MFYIYSILLFILALVFNLPLSSFSTAHQTIDVISGSLCNAEFDLNVEGGSPVTLTRRFLPQDRPNHICENGWQFNFPHYENADSPPSDQLLEYDQEGRLIKVQSSNPQKVLLEFAYAESQCTVKSYDGQTVRYSLLPYKTSYNHSFLLLEQAVLPSGLAWKYQYQEHPVERKMQLTSKESADGRFVYTDYYGNDDPNCGRVKSQWRPVGGDATPIKTLQVNYAPGQTEAYDALENKIVYEHTPFGQLTAIHHYLKNDSGSHILYRTERYHWDMAKPHFPPIGKSTEDAEGNVWKYQRYHYDESGNLTKEVLYGNLTGKGVETFKINRNGDPEGQVEGYSTSYEYEGGELIKVKGENGIALAYKYQDDLLTGKFYCENAHIRLREFYSYDDEGLLIKVIADDAHSLDPEECSGATERHITHLTVVPSGRAEGLPETIEEKYVDLSNGVEYLQKKVCHFYNECNRLVRKDHYDEQANFCYSELFEYDAGGNIICSASPSSLEEKKYDQHQNLLYQKNKENETFFTYDCANRITQQQNQSETTFFRYDFLGNKIASKDEYGIETTFEYDALSRLIRTTYPAVQDGIGDIQTPALTYAYDLFDRINAIVNAKREVTRTTYNVRGKPVKVEYPDGSSESFEYDLDGSLKKWVMKNGCCLVYQRDFLYRVIAATLFDSLGQEIQTTHAEYSAGYLKAVYSSSGEVTHYSYYPDGKQHGEVIHAGDSFHQIFYQYKPDNSLDAIEDWDGIEKSHYTKTTQKHDSSGTICEILIENQDGTILQQRALPLLSKKIEKKRYINSLGQNVAYQEELNENGQHTLTYYDSLGRVVRHILKDKHGELVHEQEFRYDLEGNKVWQKNQNGNSSQITEWEYGPGNHLIKCIEESGSSCKRITKHVYDKDRLVKTIKPDGIELITTYNSRGLIEHFYSSNGALHYSYEYDSNNQIICVTDHITKSKTHRNYSSNQVLFEELGNGLSISRKYDSKGRKTLLQLFDGSGVKYEYDTLYLREIRRIDSDQNEVYKHTYSEYDLEGKLLISNLIGQLGEIHYSYGDQSQMVGVLSPYFRQDIQLDDFGNPIKASTNDPLGESSYEYAYDSLNQLTREKTSAYSHDYVFDSFYRCIEKDGSSYQYEGPFQLAATPSLSFQYDLNGNCISQTQNGKTIRYQYDPLDRLVQVSEDDSITRYQYDSFNRRLKKVIKEFNSSDNSWKVVLQTSFLYDGDDEIGEVDAEGKILNLRILGSGMGAEIGSAIAIETGGQVYIPLYDCRGSISCLVDSKEGQVCEFYHYTAFGEETIFNKQSEIISSSRLGNPWRYSSKRVDQETGLLFFGQRYYLPKVGRWMTTDPLKADSCNDYAYLNNNPLNQIDLYGLFSLHAMYMNFFHGFKTVAKQMAFEFKTSFSAMLKQGFKNFLKHTIVEPFFFLTDFYILPSESGIYGRGEAHDKVRITHINGIMNVRKDFQISLRILTETHGGTNVHYIFRPTQGFFSDLVQAFMSKLGYASPHVRQLAAMWKELIEEMGGPEGGGLIIHYAHSLGGTDSYTAALLLTPEERRMIRVYTFGSATMLKDWDFEGVFNFVSKRDGVCLFDPLGLLKGIFLPSSNVCFVGTLKGIPLIDHWLSWATYTNVIKLLGTKFLQMYPSVD